MSEEKKDSQKEEVKKEEVQQEETPKAAEKKPEEPKAEKAPEIKEEPKAEKEAAPKAEEKKPEEVKDEVAKAPEKPVRPTVCSVTGKTLKRNQWYYKDGKWFLNKRVYKEAKIKEKEEAAKAVVEAKKEKASSE